MQNSSHNQHHPEMCGGQVPTMDMYEGQSIDHKSNGLVDGVLLDLGKILWSSGPVTFIALNLGHYCSFGSFAQMKQFIYFGTYTLFAGVLTLLASQSANALQKINKKEQIAPRTNRDLKKILEKVSQMEPKNQKILGEILNLIESTNKDR